MSTGYAASTMATDGRRVYVIFANGDCAAFTLDGKPVWAKAFGALKNPYGYATSLATWQDRLIVLLDQGEPEDGLSKLYALDGRTGRVVWERPRKVGASWASPIVIEAAGKPQVITLAVPWVISYNAKDGTELWRVNGLNGEITPSPVFAGGLVFVPSPSEKLFAIRPDGMGDVTKTHVAWTTEDNVPDVTSPVSNGELVFDLTTGGMLSCLDAKDGKKLWEHDFDMECHASPSVAGSRLYVIGLKGTAVVVEAGRQFKELFRTEMGDMFHASPAFAADRMFLRGVTNVWCMGSRSERGEGGMKSELRPDLKFVDDAVQRLGRAPDAVIPILQALQDQYGYLPEEALRRVCATTQITPAAISGVSTFYDMFRHKPVGKHIVQVCHGTACHVGGAERVEDALRRHLQIPEGARHRRGAAVHHRTRGLPWLLHARPGGAHCRGDDRLCHAREGAGLRSAISWRARQAHLKRHLSRSCNPKPGRLAAMAMGVPRSRSASTPAAWRRGRTACFRPCSRALP